MNIPNNKKRKTTINKIESAFINLIQSTSIEKITVTDLVKEAGVNRSTFYVYYLDIYDLADKIKEKMFYTLLEVYKEEAIAKEHSYNYLKMFEHIKDNQIYYSTLFKLDFDFSIYFDYMQNINNEAIKYLGTNKNVDYHIEFFKAGMSAIIKKWLSNGCKETPKEMNEILELEYKGKNN